MGGAIPSAVVDPSEVCYTQARHIFTFIEESPSWGQMDINKREFTIDSARFPFVTQPLIRNIVCELYTKERGKYQCMAEESIGSRGSFTPKWTFTILDYKPL